MKNKSQKVFELSLLVFWIIIGTIVRFTRLDVLPPWTDECATIVFSLGNSFYSVAVNKILTINNLLAPLIPNPTAGIKEVTHYLFTESTHPPVYFILTHWWLKFFPLDNGIVSVWAARSLSAILGVLGIPAIFFLARRIFPSPLVAQLAAAMMAVSPFGIFLAQQARHYTLVILLVIASLYCFLQAFKSLSIKQSIPASLGLFWVGINSLGVATHYFFIFSIVTQFLVIAYLGLRQYNQDKNALFLPHWRMIYGVIFGSIIGSLVWLPAVQSVQGSEPTDWIYESNPTTKWIEPIGRFILWILSIFMLLPSSTYDLPIGVIIGSGIVTLILLIFLLHKIINGIKLARQDEANILGIQGLLEYSIAASGLFFAVTYFLKMDLTLAPRFYFIFFPAVILIVAIGLTGIWEKLAQKPQKKTVVILLGFIATSGIITTVFNLGYLQSHRPDLFIDTLQKNSNPNNAIVIATAFKHHGHTGRMTALAWGLRDLPQGRNTQFFLAQQNTNSEGYTESLKTLESKIIKLNKPVDLWFVNFRDNKAIQLDKCQRKTLAKKSAGQYNYKLYHCQDSPPLPSN